MDDYYTNLIHKDIDGGLTEEEATALEKFLNANEEARKLHGDLKALSGMFTTDNPPQAPPDLKQQIMGSLPDNLYQPTSSRGSFWEQLTNIWGKTRFQAGMGFALGAFAMLLITSSFSTFPSSDSAGNGLVQGTILPNQTYPESTPSDIRQVKVGETDCRLMFQHYESFATLTIQSSSDTPLSFKLDYPEQDMALQFIERGPGKTFTAAVNAETLLLELPANTELTLHFLVSNVEKKKALKVIVNNVLGSASSPQEFIF